MARLRRVSSAAILAAIGAALSVGVGAALPVWHVCSPDDQRVLWNGPDPHQAQIVLAGEWVRGTLWQAARARLDGRRWLLAVGKPVPLVRPDDVFVVYPL